MVLLRCGGLPGMMYPQMCILRGPDCTVNRSSALSLRGFAQSAIRCGGCTAAELWPRVQPRIPLEGGGPRLFRCA